MKKIIMVLLIVVSIVMLGGCGDSIYPGLPNDAIKFDENDIIYKGRHYSPYGMLGKTIHENDIKECIGYVEVRTDPDSKDVRVYTLTDDDNENFLMIYITGGIMNQPDFYRAEDTKGENIEIPGFIECTDDIWK